jgi:flavorubredoxin
MVHWPEVMVSFDESTGLLFSADAFGKFGALDVNEDWTDEARRYYIGIVGKYGLQVQGLLKKLSGFGIKTIAPLHGPVLNGDLSKYLNLYNTWSSYVPEEQGILLAYTSVYGHTKVAVKELESQLLKKGVKVECVDLCRDDTAQSIALAFKYSKLVLATTTYNADIFPKMREFIDKLVERNYQNRTVAFIENGTWAPVAAKLMKAKFEKSKNLTFVESAVKIKSCINSESSAQISALADELCK